MTGTPGRLLLVGWDVAGWEVLHPLIDGGSLPTLKRLLDEGVSGDLFSPPPAVPSSQWATIATGKRAWQHHHCAPVSHHMQDEGSAPAPRTARALWEILSGQGHPSIVVGWPGTHGRQFAGISVSDRYHIPTAPPGQPWETAAAGTYSCADLRFKLDDFRVSPEEISAEAIAHFVPEWEKFDQTRSPILSQLRILLATDFSYHAAMTSLVESERWFFAAVRYPGIGDIARLFARHHLLAGRSAAKTEPLLQNVLPTAYRTMDAMLQRLIALAGTDTAVVLVSASGISAQYADASHPNEQVSLTSKGVFVAAGKGFRRDALVHGTRAPDITTTILNWFELPSGADMEGRQIPGCFSEPRNIQSCETWEEAGLTEPAGLDQFKRSLPASLGWMYEWNLAQSCLDAGRFNEALPLLERIYLQFPENPALVQTLFQTQLTLGSLLDAEQTLDVLTDALGPDLALLPQSELALARGEIGSARKLVSRLLEINAHSSTTWHRIGMLLIALREWEKLEIHARAVLERNKTDEIAWLGLAEACIRRSDFDTAALAAKRAMGLRFYLPDAHFALARALVGKGMFLAAIQAMERLIQMDPSNTVAQKYLRRLRNNAAK